MSLEVKAILEWVAVGFNLGFVLLIIQEKKIGWIFGIIGSALSILLFIQVKLYSEAILYSYYVFMGIYGWMQWNKPNDEQLKISEYYWLKHARLIFACIALSLGLGAFFKSQTDAANPYFDSFSTVFSFLATYLEAKKVLSSWLYWMIINAFSVWLYAERALPVYAALMVLYTALSIIGYIKWRKTFVAYSIG